jgi:hypothetical protein
MDQGYNETWSNTLRALLVYANVLMMLIAPVSDDTPAACSDTIKTSILTPAWLVVRLSDGCTTHAVPAPSSTHAEPMMSSHGASSSA